MSFADSDDHNTNAQRRQIDDAGDRMQDKTDTITTRRKTGSTSRATNTRIGKRK